MAYEEWAPEFRVYDRWGAYLRTLSDVRAATWTQRVGGEDSLEIECGERVGKGERVVWCDWEGQWHEHVADEPSASRSDGLPSWRVACKVSLCELDLWHVEDVRPSGSAAGALGAALAGTRWEVGSTDGLAALPASVQLYRESALDAVRELAGRLGGELWASFEAGDSGVSRRVLNCEAAMGPGDRGRRFEYGRDLAGVTRTVGAGEVRTALYGYGRGEAVGDGYGRRLTFASVNGGQAWVGDEGARLEWGVPDGRGGRLHAFGEVTFDDCEDASELLRLTRAELERRKRPQVSFSCDVAGASEAGLDATAVSLGEVVAIVDPTFSPALRAQGRVTCCEWDLLDRASSRVEVGDAVEGITDSLGELGSRVDAIGSMSAAWQAAAGGATDYVEAIISGINALCEQSMSYVVRSPELGIMVSNVPIDEATGAPRSIPSGGVRCVNLRAGVMRVASAYSGGKWQWRTAATGEGLVADAITTGTLMASLVKAGRLQDAKGNNFWDMDTGEFRLSSAATVGGKTVVDIAKGAVDAQTQQSVFDKLTNGGQEQGIFLQDGRVWVNGEYIKAGTVVAGRLGNSADEYAEVGDVVVPGLASSHGIVMTEGGRKTIGIGSAVLDGGPALGLSVGDASGEMHNVLMAYGRNTYLYTPTRTSGTPAQTALILSDGTGLTVNVAVSASEMLTLTFNSAGLSVSRWLAGKVTTKKVASF